MGLKGTRPQMSGQLELPLEVRLPERSYVTLTVHNTLGQHVSTLVEGEREAGYHDVNFDGSRLASGAYIYRLAAGDYVETRRLTLLK